MSIKISTEQAQTINGVPIDQIFVLDMVFHRDDETGNSPFSLVIKFKMSMRADTGDYVPTGKVRTVVIHDADVFAMQRAVLGDMSIVECDVALQKAIATAIASQCADLSSAEMEAV
jgi:hypothetical protein